MCESYAKSEKIDRYAPAFENSDYDFAPVVFETSGALNREGETVLKQIIRFASKREGISHSVFAARAWARLSCCIQFAAAQQILNRDYTEPVVADVFANGLRTQHYVFDFVCICVLFPLFLILFNLL